MKPAAARTRAPLPPREMMMRGRLPRGRKWSLLPAALLSWLKETDRRFTLQNMVDSNGAHLTTAGRSWPATQQALCQKHLEAFYLFFESFLSVRLREDFYYPEQKFFLNMKANTSAESLTNKIHTYQ